MEDYGERLTAMETKLSYLEDFMGKLQSIAVEHTEAIDRLKNENKALREKLGEVSDAVQDIPNVRPPHY
ncbi:MAG TPA: SlyX family protein [Treponemataceae bacterium]|nr:SlyX family protein [Treponemataceae bacterium]